MSDTPSPAAEVVTRFAPSPTGYLHIGCARTALFNWLHARSHGGRFRLRIEDTDRARHNEEAVQAILDGLAWLGLDWDGEVVSQHARAERHKAVAEDLLAQGRAYRCYCTPGELETMRETAKAEGRAVAYDRTWRDRDPADAPAGAASVVRFAQPLDGETLVKDAVQGDVRTPNASIEDLVILRADGSPTYNLAVVVDDHDMGVTDVIRGVDHLANAAKQQNIYEALGWPVPRFAHVPLIHGPDGAKLSKRHSALGVEAYRDDGFLPEGLRNYLLRLGFSHGDKEFFTDHDAKTLFDVAGVNAAPARLDLDKMASINGEHLKAAPAERLADLVMDRLDGPLADDARERLIRAAPFLKDRAQTLKDYADAARFAIGSGAPEPSKNARKALGKDGALDRVRDLHEAVTGLSDWSLETLEGAVGTVLTARGEEIGRIGPPFRAALTGGAPSPSLHEIMWVLGAQETSSRLAAALSR